MTDQVYQVTTNHNTSSHTVASQFKANIPAKRPDMTDRAYSAVISAGHCARLLSGECETPCGLREDGTYDVDFGHVVPDSKGGSTDGWNMQLECTCYNRWEKGAKDDPYYGQGFWWDEPIDLSRLRGVQKEKAWDQIHRLEADGQYISSPPDALLDIYMLMMWIVGSGKTIGLVAACKAINQIIDRTHIAARRVSRLLVLAPQESLATQLAQEYRDELLKHGICRTAPKVMVVRKPGDWGMATLRKADIVIACRQSVFDTDARKRKSKEKSAGTMLTQDDLRRHLARFEAIAVDEGHYAIEQLAYLADLAPLAFKFSLTATPMNTKGEWLKKTASGRDLFALLSVYGYEEAHGAGSLRILPEWVDGKQSGCYEPVTGGHSVELVQGMIQDGDQDSKNLFNLTRDMAVVSKGCEKASRMGKQFGYDAHVMLVCGSISHTDTWARILNHSSDQTDRPRLSTLGDGWSAIAVHSESKGASLTDDKSPWMLAKSNLGHCAKGSRRIACVKDIGQYGVNNKLCNTIIWVGKELSQPRIAQRIGRAMRRWDENDNTEVVLIWPAKFEDMTQAIEKAVTYLREMESRARDEGYVDISAYLSEASPSRSTAPIQMVPRLSTQDRALIDAGLGQATIKHHGIPEHVTPTEVDTVVDDWARQVGVTEEPRLNSARDYADKLTKDGRYRQRAFGVRSNLVCAPVTTSEKAPGDYSDDDLRRAIFAGRLAGGSVMAQQYLSLLSTPEGRAVIGAQLSDVEARYYRLPDVEPKSFQRSLRRIAMAVSEAIGAPSLIPRESYYRCVNRAAAGYFCLPNVQEATVAEIEPNLCDVIDRGTGEWDIGAITKAMVLHQHQEQCPELYALYADAISSVNHVLGGAQTGGASHVNG